MILRSRSIKKVGNVGENIAHKNPQNGERFWNCRKNRTIEESLKKNKENIEKEFQPSNEASLEIRKNLQENIEFD